jgi:hypothetical protein
VGLLPVALHGQFKFREPPNRQDPSALSEREGTFIWKQFLLNRAVGTFIMNGTLVYRPERAPSQSFELTFNGDWQLDGERSTISILSQDGHTDSKTVLLRKGEAYRFPDKDSSCDPVPLEAGDLDLPLFGSLPFSWADFLMPYLNWANVSYIGPDRFLGRPAHRFALLNSDAASFPSKVVVTLDEDYAALLKADLFNTEGTLVKRLRVGGFKQFNEDWMFSELSWSNRLTRESVQFKVSSFTMDP